MVTFPIMICRYPLFEKNNWIIGRYPPWLYSHQPLELVDIIDIHHPDHHFIPLLYRLYPFCLCYTFIISSFHYTYDWYTSPSSPYQKKHIPRTKWRTTPPWWLSAKLDYLDKRCARATSWWNPMAPMPTRTVAWREICLDMFRMGGRHSGFILKDGGNPEPRYARYGWITTNETWYVTHKKGIGSEEVDGVWRNILMWHYEQTRAKNTTKIIKI